MFVVVMVGKRVAFEEDDAVYNQANKAEYLPILAKRVVRFWALLPFSGTFPTLEFPAGAH